MSDRLVLRSDPRAPPALRHQIVGTGTEVGKTTVTCALALTSRALGHACLAFKPACTGAPGPTSDPARLAAACGLADPDLLAPLQWHQPIAPGLASDRPAFVEPGAHAPSQAPMHTARAALDALEHRHAPARTFIEWAGGLLVPMPGGTWQDEWIATFAAPVILVAGSGLGTLNHTLLTLEALRERKRTPRAIVISHAQPPGAVERDNVAVLRARLADLPCVELPPVPALARSDTMPTPEQWPRRSPQAHAALSELLAAL